MNQQQYNYYDSEGFEEYQEDNNEGPANLQVPESQLYTEGMNQPISPTYTGYEYSVPKQMANQTYRPYSVPNKRFYRPQQRYQNHSSRPKNPGTPSHYNQYTNYQPTTTYYDSTGNYNSQTDDYYYENYPTEPTTNETQDYSTRNTGKQALFVQHYSGQFSTEPPVNGEYYGEYSGNKSHGQGPKIGAKKYPITVKTPTYVQVGRNSPSNVAKKPSKLCLPVVTQRDPAMIKRKTNKSPQQSKKNTTAAIRQESINVYDQSEFYSAHEMHSQGDVKSRFSRPKLTLNSLDNFLNNCENELILNTNENIEEKINEENNDGLKVKEFAKFLKPRVPSSVKLRQEHAEMKSLRPKMKLSLDRLLNRLSKCEPTENESQSSESKVEVNQKDPEVNSTKENALSEAHSFNYEELSRKCSSQSQTNKICIKIPSKERPKSSLSSIDNKRSVKVIKPMDDHCALDLHRSKSYIVDLIDRALSNELGTVPRSQSSYEGLTPSKAVATISKHHPNHRKELCYEVTAALTDSIISSATAPKFEGNEIAERTSNRELDQGGDNYIKQLKQLRWGHIRHIQQEVKKLADLEEFLENCGEIDY